MAGSPSSWAESKLSASGAVESCCSLCANHFHCFFVSLSHFLWPLLCLQCSPQTMALYYTVFFLANVRSATAFKTSDAINELSCIYLCRFLKTSPLLIFCTRFHDSVLFGLLYLPIVSCHWPDCVTFRKHLELKTR